MKELISLSEILLLGGFSPNFIYRSDLDLPKPDKETIWGNNVRRSYYYHNIPKVIEALEKGRKNKKRQLNPLSYSIVFDSFEKFFKDLDMTVILQKVDDRGEEYVLTLYRGDTIFDSIQVKVIGSIVFLSYDKLYLFYNGSKKIYAKDIWKVLYIYKDYIG